MIIYYSLYNSKFTTKKEKTRKCVFCVLFFLCHSSVLNTCLCYILFIELTVCNTHLIPFFLNLCFCFSPVDIGATVLCVCSFICRIKIYLNPGVVCDVQLYTQLTVWLSCHSDTLSDKHVASLPHGMYSVHHISHVNLS